MEVDHLNSQQPDDKAASYRQIAQQIRKAVLRISLHGSREQLLEAAKHLDVLANIEEHKAGKVAPIQSPRRKA
jgi:dihydroorotase-like cyclic amidohydrolase